MKEILSNIVKSLEEIATNLASMENALIQRGLLQPGELDNYTDAERIAARHQVANLRHWISQLPE